MKLSLIVPAYNEAGGIERTVRELDAYMKGFNGCDEWEIIVVNDGSTDGTMDILNALKSGAPRLNVVDLVTNRGRGKAVRAGIAVSNGDIVVTLDADLSYQPYHIERMVTRLRETGADIVVASAYREGGSVRNVPKMRLWISRLGNRILSYAFRGGISVLTCIVRAYKGEFIRKLDLHADDKDLHLEILYKAKILNARIEEVPADLVWPEAVPASGVQSQNDAAPKPAARRSTMRLKKTGGSHFFFALMSRPGLMYMAPGGALFIVAFIMLAIIVFRLVLPPWVDGTTFYTAVRDSMLGAPLVWLTFTLSFILAIQFISLGFLMNQNKKNYEELYKTLHSILEETKKR